MFSQLPSGFSSGNRKEGPSRDLDGRDPPTGGKAFDAFLKTYEAKYPKATTCLEKDRKELQAFYRLFGVSLQNPEIPSGLPGGKALREIGRTPKMGLFLQRVVQRIALAQCHQACDPCTKTSRGRSRDSVSKGPDLPGNTKEKSRTMVWKSRDWTSIGKLTLNPQRETVSNDQSLSEEKSKKMRQIA